MVSLLKSLEIPSINEAFSAVSDRFSLRQRL